MNGQQFDITGGTRAGANLFHSFAKFGLSQAQIAHFLSNPAVRNILARVTGGDASVINGLIKVTGGNSNLYLMNPAGIVFGPNASLNVPAAFHATTANAIKIGDGYFGMNTTAAELAVLTAEPNGYAFSSLNQNLNPGTPTGVIVNQGNLSVNGGQTIVLAGNQVINTGTIQSPNGTVIIAATADGKYVNVSQSGSILSLDLPVAVNQNLAVQNLRPVLPNDIPQLLTGTAYVSGTVTTASEIKNPDSLINITGERVILDRANLDNLGTDGLIQIRVAPGIANEGYVFLDRVRNYEQLVNALAPGSELYLINRSDSGVEKVNQVIAKNGAVQRIDIVGDGNAGQIWFGRDFITVDTLPQYEAQIAQWGQGLTGNREIYLYACNLAASIAGKELVGEISSLTNSTVAASTDITGSSQYGGNWQFEYSTGNVAGQIVFDAQAVQNADVKLATFTVLNTNDAGADSLRQAVIGANALVGADEIKFAPGTNGTPIILTTGGLLVNDAAGLTITGNGQTNTIIDGNKASGVFNVTAGDITFDGVTIRNGNAPGNGGGINNALGNVTLTNATVSNNTAGMTGGGIFAGGTGGTVTLTNSTVSDNTANKEGGGIRANGTVTLTDSIVSGNTANGSGGGIKATTVTLTDSIVSGNTANGSGGGINSGIVTLTNSTVSENTVTVGNGGGIRANGTVTLTNSTVSGNVVTTRNGGGINAGGTVTLTNSTVSDNTANKEGGGIRANGTVTLTNSTVSGNTAGTKGGGILTFSTGGTIRNSTIAFNTADNSGGIFRNGGTIDIGNSIVAQNTATTTSPDIGSSTVGTGYINAGNNLIGINTGFEGTFATGTLVGTAGSPVDPLLGALANNGGATLTHALLTGSPAINAGNNAITTVTTDQRGVGFPRISGGTVDIGAFEVQMPSPPVTPPISAPFVPVEILSFSNLLNIILRGPEDLIFSQFFSCSPQEAEAFAQCLDNATFTIGEMILQIE
ncbi:filamentous hemagglutinin family outer membrane protein [Gloeomargarita lithophora Alchichica-D10]|uniref:Filamentous hemagglutinin family outer membrane protein n=2 Tax=Gloeomargarita TaxID=1188227 RepID=A0A1J0A8R5_9CYAN|nr:DUF4347 domain-containing protein [Gloeomargarita lithophora]APB32318.1 filamentous hemagglutinin family outer membrane protein [Gloeomargarita lithophora Alchichica-D10]